MQDWCTFSAAMGIMSGSPCPEAGAGPFEWPSTPDLCACADQDGGALGRGRCSKYRVGAEDRRRPVLTSLEDMFLNVSV